MSSKISIKNLEVKISDEGLYCLNDIHKASGGKRSKEPHEFLNLHSTNELVKEILITSIPAIKKSAGRYGGTYVCKELVYAYAMWISPKFHLEVIKVFDNKIKAERELASLVENVKYASNKLCNQLDKTSMSLSELKTHGHNWGAYGIAIKKAKREASKELKRIKDEIQFKLDFIG